MAKNALLVVDVQNDFCSGGTLPVQGCDEIVPVINRYMARFERDGFPVFASRDWHPETTAHFIAFGGKWPAHCIQNTRGARFRKQLKLPETVTILTKGTSGTGEGYTAFEGRDDTGTLFDEIIEKQGIRSLAVCGLATDYCVLHSVLDALERGLRVYLLLDAIRGVDAHPGDSVGAIDAMIDKGAIPVTYETLTLELE